MKTGFHAILAAAMLTLASAAIAAPDDKSASQPPSFTNLTDGQSVTSPVAVKVDSGMGNMRAASGDGGSMMMMMPGGHTHLLVDSPQPMPGDKIPVDAHHIHLMHGTAETMLTLTPGDHTLQLVNGSASHQVASPMLASQQITIHVLPGAPPKS